MAERKQTDVGSLRVGGFVLLDNIACKIIDVQTSKTGKHGHTKCRIEAVGIINSEKKIFVKPSSDKIDIPIVEKKSAQVLSVHGDVANVMDSETYETFDIKVPEELKGKVKEDTNVIYWIIMDEKVIMQVK